MPVLLHSSPGRQQKSHTCVLVCVRACVCVCEKSSHYPTDQLIYLTSHISTPVDPPKRQIQEELTFVRISLNISTQSKARESYKMVVRSFGGEILQIQTKDTITKFPLQFIQNVFFFKYLAYQKQITQLINGVMPSFLQRIINISNLYHPNQHLPHLFRDLKFGAQRGDQTPPLVFHSTVLHDSNHYKVDKTFRQSPEEEGKTEQNKSLP